MTNQTMTIENSWDFNKERFKLLVENCNLIIFELTVNGDILFTNSLFQVLLGYESEEIPAKNILELLHPIDVLEFNQKIPPLLKDREPFTYESRIRHKNGSWIWFEWVANILKTKTGETDILIVATNINERKKLEEDLRLAAELLKHMPDAVTVTDYNGVIQQWTGKSVDIFGYNAEEVIGKEANILHKPSIREKTINKIIDYKLTNNDFNLEIPCLRKDGTEILIETHGRTFFNRDEEPIALIGFHRDITKLKQVEETLRLTNQLQQIIEFLPDATFVLDQNKTVIAWNRAIETMTGVCKQEIIGKKDQEYSVTFYGKKRPMLIDYIWSDQPLEDNYYSVIRENENIYARTLVDFLPIGKQRIIEIKASPLKNNNGNIIGAIECMRDITRQQEIEEESLKIQKIESIGVLAGGLAHDFNNLLAGILANIQLIKMKLEKGKDIFKPLSTVEDIIKQAANLTQQLLTFSKGGSPVKKATCLNELIRESVKFVLRGSRCKCQYTIAKNLWMIDADSGQISQVISNIVINADQAMPSGGIIKIEARNYMIDKENLLPLNPGKYVKISITDTGMGIPPEHLSKIFDPYFTTKNSGNGLGLATSALIISRHNGYIDVRSEPGIETVFFIYLPAIDIKSSLKNKNAAVINEGIGRILLMDDEEMIRNAAGELLSEIGYEVACAREGEEAIDLYTAAKNGGRAFDLIIMDLTIPGGLGGKETIKRLREIDPQIKAIVTSGYSNDLALSNFAEYGFSGVVSKPYKIEELNSVLKKVLD